MEGFNNYQVGDYVVVRWPGGYIPPALVEYRKRYIGKTATIREVHVNLDGAVTHAKLDIDTESEDPSSPVGPWYATRWFEPIADQMNFSFSESEITSLL